uniref:Uncharacterized protein n=1 Tax=Anopheles quadriannulatus TaxID=34691 RepID=A0A182XQS7_ANOQN
MGSDRRRPVSVEQGVSFR